MNNITYRKSLLSMTGASNILSIEPIQELWSGYGEIVRVELENASPVVVKHIRWPENPRHPRGWNSDASHQRKVKSYEVEINFYREFERLCDDSCRVPKFVGADKSGGEILLVLEDLNYQGFSKRVVSINDSQIHLCISWLAQFHAKFLGVTSKNLWEVGTYWHLDTRMDELNALTDTKLKNAAPLLHNELICGVPQTLVHGDAKLANFCFHINEKAIAAVDFQYVGSGCGMKDLAYFIGSCLTESESERQESSLLDYYFCELRKAFAQRKKTQDTKLIDIEVVEMIWRRVYPTAWADFHRFLKGWSSEHWKINSYSEKMCRQALSQLSIKQS